MKIRKKLIALLAGLSTAATGQQAASSSPLSFSSSVPSLQQSFVWAKSQALAYSRPASGDMGPWFEAALPGRNAFCIRDASHQSQGVAALGLYAAEENVFRLYAASIAAPRDWAGFWEIDSLGRPAKEDYVSDKDFWFNLPANFDALDAIVRAWRWTGNAHYRDDAVFQRLFRTTLTEYLRSWRLTPDTILSRPRIANQRQSTGQFVNARGIPSYTEETTDFIFGTDLLASEYRAMTAFSEIAVTTSDRSLANQLQPSAAALQAILERVAWSETQHHYFRTIHRDLTGSGSGDALLLYFGAIGNEAHRRASLDYVSDPHYWKNINLEEETYLPSTLFRYDRTAAAYQVLEDLSSPNKPRREYPEASFAVIEAIVSGVMGLEPSSAQQPFDVSTRSQLLEGEATLSGVSICGNLLAVTHTGTSATRLANTSGPALRWRATFPDTVARLFVDGHPVTAHHSLDSGSSPVSWVDVTVMPGHSILVQRK